MDQGPLVDEDIIEGRRFIEQFVADGNPISAAAWIKANDDDPWELYLATEVYDRPGPRRWSDVLIDSFRKLDDPLITTSQINLIGAGDSITPDLQRLALLHPKRPGFRIRVDRLGLNFVNQVYVYSQHLLDSMVAGAMTTEDIGREVLRLLMQSSEARRPARVTLKDGTGFDGVPVTLHRGEREAMRVRFDEVPAATSREVTVGEIASIR